MAGSRLGQRKRIRTCYWIALVVCAAVLVAAFGLGLSATYRPAWYRPVSIDRMRLREDKRALVALADEIGGALNRAKRLSFQLREDQVNRWIAARAQMWPDTPVDLGPLACPQVSFVEGRIRAAATLEHRGLRAVISVSCRVKVSDDTVAIEWESARLGALPVPRSWVSGRIAQIPSAGQLPVVLDGRGTLLIANDWIWPNGKRRCRLSELQVLGGVANVVLEPLPAGR